MYKAHGALLLRGFAFGVDDFRRFAEQFCAASVYNDTRNRLVLDAEHNIQSVDRGVDPFPLHPELSREPWKPDVCFFGCLDAPSAGGETTICDGIELVRRLPAEVRDGLSGRRLLHVMGATPARLMYWLGTETPGDAQLAAPPAGCPFEFRRIGAAIAVTFSRPALHRPMFAEGPAFGNFLLFARARDNRFFPVLDDEKPVPDAWVDAIRAAGEAIAVPIAWRRDDLLMLDNTRFMHGRRAILDPGERRIASYFGYLRFAPPSTRSPPIRRGAGPASGRCGSGTARVVFSFAESAPARSPTRPPIE
ncbi:MAG: TauD/TfdA family dioxygenase [Sphingomonas sp.]